MVSKSTTMKTKRILTRASAMLMLSLIYFSCAQMHMQPDEMTHDEYVARGKYLVTTASCNDCHSPKVITAMGPVEDSTRLLSGHPANSVLPFIDTSVVKAGWFLMSGDITAFVGPWGISYAANLTPDSVTGIGAWSEASFVKALRTGKHLGLDGGRPILPPMPWQYVGKFTDEDLKAIFTYLQSLPPVKNAVPAPMPPDQVGKALEAI